MGHCLATFIHLPCHPVTGNTVPCSESMHNILATLLDTPSPHRPDRLLRLLPSSMYRRRAHRIILDLVHAQPRIRQKRLYVSRTP